MDISYYMKIQNAYETSSRKERELAKINREVKRHFRDTCDHENVLRNGEEYELIIVEDTENNTYRKKIKSLNGDYFNMGDTITWNNQKWIVNALDPDDKTWNSGYMVLCTLLLSWQNAHGEIVQRWCYDENFTKYSSGVTGNKTLQTGEFQFGIQAPLDSETKLLSRDKRFIIDVKEVDAPDAYDLTGRDVTTGNYEYFDRGGIINLTLSYGSFNVSKDKLIELDSGEKVWIADYIEPPTLPPVPDGNQSEVLCRIEYSGKPRIIIGSNYKKFTAVFYDTAGNIVSDQLANWKVTADDTTEQYVHTKTNNDNSIQIKIDYNDALAGKYLKLDAVDVNNICSSSIFVEIGGAI